MEQSHDSHIRVDLSEISFISPGAMVFLVLLLESLAASAGRRPVLLVPDLNVHSYLGRAGLFESLGELIDVEPPVEENQRLRYEALRGTNQNLLELTPLKREEEIDHLLFVLQSTLGGKLGYEKNDARDFAVAASEISHNIFDHNDAGIHGWVVMQVYQGSGEGFVELAIGDGGVGINGSMTKNPNFGSYDSDLAAISHAIQTGVSRFVDQERGQGFDALMEKVFKHNGSVTIRSGNGKVRIRTDKETKSFFEVPRMDGTQVVINLPQKEAHNGCRSQT